MIKVMTAGEYKKRIDAIIPSEGQISLAEIREREYQIMLERFLGDVQIKEQVFKDRLLPTQLELCAKK